LVFAGIFDTKIILPESDTDKSRNVSDSRAKRAPDKDRHDADRMMSIPDALDKAESFLVLQEPEGCFDLGLNAFTLIIPLL
jgi:hypothetical protein